MICPAIITRVASFSPCSKNANYDCYMLAEVAESKKLGRFLRGFWVRM